MVVSTRADTLRKGDVIVLSFKRDNVTPLRTEKVEQIEYAPAHCHRWRNHLHVNGRSCYFRAGLVWVDR